MKRTIKLFLLVLLFTLITVTAASGQQIDRSELHKLPDSVAAMRLNEPITVSQMDLDVNTLEGPQRVIVHLLEKPLAETDYPGNLRQAQSHLQKIEAEQASFLARVSSQVPGLKELGRVQKVLNAVFIEVDAADLNTIAQDHRVTRIAPVADYQLDLSETVPYVGGTAVQNKGYDGTGIRVAVLDSGIDYLHANLGGSGDPNEYLNNDPNVIEPGTFPTARVVDGYDFVGSTWPNTAEIPDPDPLDDGPASGHGTHVADIIGGENGMAPDVDLYAVKVCSSVSTSCSGLALIQGMEFAIDPNGDGNTRDRVDIINMSLGSDYGQPFDDDLSLAVDNATKLGVLTVASAGNASDKPYIVGTPSAAKTALSVAQTQVPSAALQLISVDGADYPAVFQPWSTPLTSTISGQVQYGDGAGGNLDGCAAFAPGSLAGLIVLVDRGGCNFTLKVKNVADAGGVVGIIGLIAPGAPFSGGDGGDRPINIPGYMISQADSNAIKAAIAGGGGAGVVDPANQLPLVGQMVGSSSRGPSNYYQWIKPEIGAPGASVSAIAGSGTGEGPFGGTSGAAPMVSGAAALLLDAFDGHRGYNGFGHGFKRGFFYHGSMGKHMGPLQVKALLMNTGETDIDTDPFLGLAPITRIGGGEVRVDRALKALGSAWDIDTYQGALSFGMVDVANDVVKLRKTVFVDLNEGGCYRITPTFRYQDDIDNGAVTVKAPSKVCGGRFLKFKVTLTIDGSLLRGNAMNSGVEGANPDALTLNEYDGYLVIEKFTGHSHLHKFNKHNNKQPIHLAWHVLPRQAAEVIPDRSTIVEGGFPDVIGLDNVGVGTAQNDAYALLAVSPDLPEGARGGQSPTPDTRAVGINTFTVPANFCSADPSFVWAFAVNTHERQTHVLPVSHQIWLDINQDGLDDYVVLNRDFSGLSTISDGRQLTWALDLTTGAANAFFYTEHSTNTGNTVLLVCAEQIGLTGADLLATNVDMDVITQDFYFGGPGDEVLDLTVTPLGERFYGVPTDVPGNTYDADGLLVYDFGLFPGNTPELGVMLVTNGDRGAGARGGATQDSEALLFTLP